MTASPRPIRILKFGGTSVADAQHIERVVELVLADTGEVDRIVVVSAMGGVTQLLVEASDLAAAGDPSYRERVDAVLERCREALATLVPQSELTSLQAVFDGWAGDLRDLLHGVSLVRECTPRTRDSILCFGELVSASLVAAAFRRHGHEAAACDARALVCTDADFGHASVDMAATRDLVGRHFGSSCSLQVVTGFIAATAEGETTTLGRGGSDYTAALLGALLAAERVEIWTDVDGVMSADPRLVPEAFSLPALSYEELLELSHFGAKVVYPRSVHPARQQGIPLLIRNTLNPAFPGTWVGAAQAPADERPIRGISSIREVVLLRLEGDGMVGVPGVAGRLFRSLARHSISVILISQASSEHSICFAVEPSSLSRAMRAIEDEFRLERGAGLVDELSVETDVSVIAVVGSGMRERPGVAGRLFSLLGRRGINVRAIAQGSSELNISVVVSRSQVEAGVRALHDAFFAPSRDVAHIYLAGVGNVGGELIRQMSAVADAPRDCGPATLRLAGVADSKRSATTVAGLAWEGWGSALAEAEADAHALVDAALLDPAEVRIFVDCSANDTLPESYPALLAAGASVVAANKKGFAGSWAAWAERRRGPLARSYIEATVGAGLPILRTVEDLVRTGDRVLHAQCVLSGTMAYLFSQVMDGRLFSDALAEARTLGYTEPDPRDDLSGLDVLRKLVILSREIGWTVEPGDVTVHPVLPGEGWEALSVDAFLARLPEVDAHFEELRRAAAAEHGRLCFLAEAEEGHASVAVRVVGPGHPCHSLAGTDNLVALRTERYSSPLVIRGPGAGRTVTASGVLADILHAIGHQRGRIGG
ncbi:MAG TPA: bifunctional aspartate kinase/homoserine dehydrogenase I [Longimicrobiales bacterium]|nr:bifunctional aspartate kinase/homoserine dehydrogenase I [Longimicrobiales bacterium]